MSDAVGITGQQQGGMAHAGKGHCCLAPGVPGTDDDAVVHVGRRWFTDGAHGQASKSIRATTLASPMVREMREASLGV